MLFSDYLDLWLPRYASEKLKANSLYNYRYAIKNHIKPYFQDKQLEDITPLLLLDYLMDKKKIFQKTTLKTHYSILNNCFRYAVFPYRLLDTNPMEYVEMPVYHDVLSCGNLEDDIFTTDEIVKILDFYPRQSPYRLALEIAFHTGMRSGEVTALTWNDVDFKKKTISVNKNLYYDFDLKSWQFCSTKSAKGNRVILIDDYLVELLKYHKHLQDISRAVPLDLGDMVLRKSDGTLFTSQTIKYMSKVLKKKLNMPKFHFHLIRHTHATLLEQSGVDIIYLQYRLGHSNYSTTMDFYVHPTKKMEKDALKAIDLLLPTSSKK